MDVPDDALYYAVAAWEWMRWCFVEGHDPWFVPGKLGGVPLYADAVPMGPFYPGSWPLAVMPAHVALPLVCALHGVGTLLSVRWLARTLGASPVSATLAGAAISLGPLGIMGYVDCRADAWPLIVWFPVALAALERTRGESGASALRWTAVAAAALGLVLLGSHIRLGIAAMVVFGLWGLLGGRFLHVVIAGAFGLLAGAPGFLPVLLEWGQAGSNSPTGGRLDLLGTPIQTGLTFPGLPGWLAPRPWVSYADYSVGIVLAIVLLLELGRGRLRPGSRDPAARMAILVGVVVAAAFSPSIPGLRYVFAPLLLLSHPVNDVFSATALLVAAAVAAVALDQLVSSSAETRRRRLRGPGAVAVLALFAGGVALWLFDDFRDARGRTLYLVGLSQAAVGIAATFVVLSRRHLGRKAIVVLFAIGLLDLGAFAVRMNTAVPSAPLGWEGRTDVQGVASLAGGYLDIDDLSRLEAFAYEGGDTEADDTPGAEPEPEEFWEDTAAIMQEEILHRRWPPHLGMAQGIRALSGRAKLPPTRQLQMLEPLAERLRRDGSATGELGGLFAEGGLGWRTLRLHDIRAAAAPDGVVHPVPAGMPWCSSPSQVEVESQVDGRIARLLEVGFEADGRFAIVEDESVLRQWSVRAEVQCDSPPQIEVDAPSRSVVVLRERFHPGWIVRWADGSRAMTFPVNQVHLGFAVPAGRSEASLSFEQPGLGGSVRAAGAAWLLIAVAFGIGWESRSRPKLRAGHAETGR